MKNLIFEKFDAFAQGKSTGNPAACIQLEKLADLSDVEMLHIAKQLKGFVNEVGFISPLSDQSFKLKYYSAEREVDFCGHATIGIMYNIIKNNKELLSKKEIIIDTNVGKLMVYNGIVSEDVVYIAAPLPQVKDCAIPPMQIFEHLQLSVNEVDIRYPFQVINAGLQTLVLPINKLETLLKLNPDEQKLKQFCKDHSIDIIALFCKEVAHKENFIRSRVFAPTFGYLEDPATGSGNSAIGYYLLQQRFWNGEPIRIEQNNNFEHPNVVKIKILQSESHAQVLFGGNAVTRIRGSYLLEN